MDWIQAFTIIGVLGAFITYLIGDVKASVNKLESELKTDMKAQTARIDQLYQMFIEARNDSDRRFEAMNQKFYDLLKEGRKQ